MALSNILDWLFAPFVNLFGTGIVTLVILALIFTALTTFVYKKFTNQQELKNIKDEMTNLRTSMKDHKDNPDKLAEINKKILELTGKQMRSAFSPKLMLVNLLPIFIVLGWINSNFKVKEDLVSWGFNIPLFGTGLGAIGIYILGSIIFSIILRKIFKIY